jgi:hypothetical protein
MRIAMLALLLLISSQAEAISLRETNTIWVNVNDYASGGCWTNLKEVRDYTEATLVNKGAVVVQNNIGGMIDEKHFRVAINVTAQRLYSDGTGPCYGSIEFRLDGLDNIYNQFSWNVIEHSAFIEADNNNFNRAVLTVLSDFLKSLK